MKKKYFLYFFLIFFTTFLWSQNDSKIVEIGIPKVTTFLPNDYNGEAQSFDFIQDNKGILFVANTSSFLEFNGIKWRSFIPDNKGIPISFAKDKNGRIYAGGTEFIGYFNVNKQGQTVFVSLKNKLPKNFFIGFVWNVFTLNNTVYFKNDNNIISYDGKKCTIIESTSPVKWMIKEGDTIFVSTSKGLYKIKNNLLVLEEGFSFYKDFFVRNIVQKNDTSKYIFTLKNGVFLFDEVSKKTKKINTTLSHFLSKNYVSFLTKLSDGNIAISTLKGGLIIVDENLQPVYRITDKSGLTNNNVKRVFQDNQQNLWIGTDRGICKINYPIHTTFYTQNKQKLGTVEEITNYNNTIYIGSSKGTFQLNPISSDDLFTDHHFAQFTHLSNDGINNFANIVSHKKLYFGGYNKMMVFDGVVSKKINNLNPRKFYNSIYNPNVMFLGHAYGCTLFFFNEQGNIIKSEKIPNLTTEIRGVAEDKHKNLWLTTVSNGVFKVTFLEDYKVDAIAHYTVKDGLPSMRDNLVYNITNNEVVFTTHKGVFKFDEDQNKFIPDDRFGEKYKGGKDEFIYAFNFDKKQQAWLHSFRKKETAVSYLNKQKKYQINDADFTEINHMQIYEILSQPNKKVTWFGGADGVARYDKTKDTQKKDTLFYALISKVISNHDSIVVGGHQFDRKKKIALKKKDIRFEVGVTHYQDLAKNRFQYYLEGYDNKWSDWSKEPFKIYTNLNHGKYTFKVRAKNVVNRTSSIDTFSFVILPKWYETAWAKLIFLLVLIGFIAFIVNYFSKRKFVKRVHEIKLKQQFEQEKNSAIIKEQEKGIKAMIEAQEKERATIARELHDGVVQQIGSVILRARTFLEKNNLTKTPESQDLLQNLEQSNQDLRTISHQMMPRALKELGIVPALKDLLENSLPFANIRYTLESFNLNGRLPQNIEITIYRITQELINNIIKHSKASEVQIMLYTSDNDVILIVEDDGVGSKKINKKGIGLLNITSRLDAVQGDVHFESSPKSGTLVTIKIPIKHAN